MPAEKTILDEIKDLRDRVALLERQERGAWGRDGTPLEQLRQTYLGNTGAGLASLASQPCTVRAATKVVAAANSADKPHADFVCDGITDSAAILRALAVMPLGGTLIFQAGLYNLQSTILVSALHNYLLLGYGATLSFFAITAIRITQDVGGPATWGCVVEGFRLDGNNSGASIGVEIRDTSNSFLRQLYIARVGVGIWFHNYGAGKFCEVCGASNIVIDGLSGACIRFTKEAGADISFMETYLENIYLSIYGAGGKGIDVQTLASVERSFFRNVTIWSAVACTAVYVDGAVNNSYWEIAFESWYATGVGVVAVELGANALGTDVWEFREWFAGPIGTYWLNAFARPLPQSQRGVIALPFVLGAAQTATNPGVAYVIAQLYTNVLRWLRMNRGFYRQARITAIAEGNEAGAGKGLAIYWDANLLCEVIWNGAGLAGRDGAWTDITELGINGEYGLELRAKGSSATEDLTIYSAWLQLR